eukprot:TRINITY_DN37537_c0_g1_i1.p1 TRINITY_DN37537_c0_g1~~TRINITY_DN37537_c0_g1_i1.p1  ORF type:complete len:593 (-),score=55.36 TRINITY_DN37537_c0_g1_i1:30-1808(-)
MVPVSAPSVVAAAAGAVAAAAASITAGVTMAASSEPDGAAIAGTDPALMLWAKQTAHTGCDAACRLAGATSDRGRWWEALEGASNRVCRGCDERPWMPLRDSSIEVWQKMHAWRLSISAVGKHLTLMKSCPRGAEIWSRGTRCLAGHFAHAVLCFFYWVAQEQETYALVNLESAMDLAWVVQRSPCSMEWGFTVDEVAVNYERILTAVWHLHQSLPRVWLKPERPFQCRRPRAEPHELTERTPASPVLLCLVLVLYPSEIPRMHGIADTYAQRCDKLWFMTASDAPKFFRGYPLLDMRTFFNMTPDPGPASAKDAASARMHGASFSRWHDGRLPNTIEKTLLAFKIAGIVQARSPGKADVICRLDSDTLFVPENLRRILVCRNFSSSAPWALGQTNYIHKLQLPGRAFLSGGNGICLSRGGLDQFAASMDSGALRKSKRTEDWDVGCVLVPGHWDDVVFGSCLAQLGIPVSRWDTDCEGRSLFWPRKLEGFFQVRALRNPPKTTFFHPPDNLGHLRNNETVQSYLFWRYRSWQHLPCQQRYWIGRFPVSSHPYHTPDELRRAFALVDEQRTMRGYTPQVWDGSAAQCADLEC